MIKLNLQKFARRFAQRFGAIAIAMFLPLAIAFTHIPAAQAFDAPELLPEKYTNVIDLGRFLTDPEESALDQKLTKFEEQTGWKLRVLTQVDRTPGRAVKEFWGLDDNSVMLVADARGRNLLNFSVGDAIYPLLSRSFWIELQSRYGNQFYVREQGYDQSILSAIDAIATCLDQDGCAVVPGIPQEQWILTLITSIVGGVVFGFAGHPRKDGEIFAWKWALIFTPLWGMLFISFGLGPVLTRTSEWVPIVRNVAGFVGGAVIAYLIPSPRRVTPSTEAR
ncbi:MULTISPECIES: TPM domain-containing protein [Pseudanabaena]|uniref:TPM domain-containing protein n=1 Tax=Pseudanabaena TaxID=1152 RepID=UPI002B202CD2|nr:TPM domain-containing protein [Pseudanabaena sp. CCNP1317]MEA5487319.1 TPM domain-containing protein [Pseudanabaena sp. CCNP1317]